jgi:PTS system nitrogen regulatory IIA component
MHLGDLTRHDLIFVDLPGSDPPTLLRALAERAHASGLVEDPDELYHRLFEREQLASTGLGAGIAVPHCKVEDIEQVVLAIGVAQRPIDFDAVDGEPVRHFFLIISPEDDPAAHLQALAAVSRWLKADDHSERIASLSGRDEIHDLLATSRVAAGQTG